VAELAGVMLTAAAWGAVIGVWRQAAKEQWQARGWLQTRSGGNNRRSGRLCVWSAIIG
jgi:hypothetical protein